MRTLTLALILSASVASAQPIVIPHDPHPVPDFCLSSGAVSVNLTIAAPLSQPTLCVKAGVTVTLQSALTVTTLVVQAGGTLVVESGASITFNDVVPTDAGQYGTGMIVAGTLRMTGAARAPRFRRLAVEPPAGSATLTMDGPVTGWLVGDRIVVPDSRHLRQGEQTGWAPTTPQWETRTITGINGPVLTLDAPLTYSHPGAKDATGAMTFLPHVGNLSGSIVVKSPAGAVNRGHTLATARADVDVRHVRFENLGRTTIAELNTTTNVAGRYPIHAHHLMGPVTTPPNGYQFTFIGNSIDGGDAVHDRKWGVAIHDSHYGLIQGNVVYNMSGAAFMFEDGSESFNVVDGNFAVRSRGVGGRLEKGVEGGGFWFRGPNNYVRNNVAADLWGSTTEAAYGFKFFFYYLGDIKVPNYKGADTMVAGQYTTVHGNKMPVLEFTNNEVYAAAQGFTYWWINSQGSPGDAWNPAPAETVFRDLKIWHVFNVGVYHYPSDRITFDGLTIRGAYGSGVTACCGRGWFGSDYPYRDLVIRRADIQGMATGIIVPTIAHGPFTLEDSTFRNNTDVVTSTMWSVGGGGRVKPRTVTVRNSTFGAWPGRAHIGLARNWNSTGYPPTAYNLPTLDEMKVYAYQGVHADNFQLYYPVQATEDVAGGLAPCTTTRPEMTGLACVIPTDQPIPCEGTWAETITLAPLVCDATQQQTRTVTNTFTQTSGDISTCPASPVVATTVESCVYVPPPPTGSIEITRLRPQSCDIRLASTPPDATGGWGVQFTLNGVNAGTRDTTAPYQRDRSRVDDGAIAAGIWSKTGLAPLPFTIGPVVCEP